MKEFIKRSGLTSKELGVIAFLLVTFSAGIFVKYSGWKKPNEYDYSETDKNFESRLKSSFEELRSAPSDSLSSARSQEILAMADSLELNIEQNTAQKKQLRQGIKVNINTALVSDLRNLNGIGEVMAERIIEYRQLHGKFAEIEDIKRVKGIGEKKFEEIKDHITVE